MLAQDRATHYTERNNFLAREMKTFSLNITPLGTAKRSFPLFKSKHLKPFFSLWEKFANNDDVAIFKLYF